MQRVKRGARWVQKFGGTFVVIVKVFWVRRFHFLLSSLFQVPLAGNFWKFLLMVFGSYKSVSNSDAFICLLFFCQFSNLFKPLGSIFFSKTQNLHLAARQPSFLPLFWFQKICSWYFWEQIFLAAAGIASAEIGLPQLQQTSSFFSKAAFARSLKVFSELISNFGGVTTLRVYLSSTRRRHKPPWF